MRFAEVDGLRMAYREVGAGRPILFLHGNPASSYLWRNILDPVARHGRCVAPDLIGMGASGKVLTPGPAGYRFADHADLLEKFLEVVGIRDDVVIVGWPNQQEVTVPGLHFLPEDSPAEITTALTTWLTSLPSLSIQPGLLRMESRRTTNEGEDHGQLSALHVDVPRRVHRRPRGHCRQPRW